MRTNRGIPVRFTPTDRYTFSIDTEDVPDTKLKALRILLDSMGIDWEEFYVLGDSPKQKENDLKDGGT